MVVKKEEKDGLVECLYQSSNIIASEYDETKSYMTVTFKSGTKYGYFDVLHRDYIRFELSESQGVVFNKTMRKYKYEKLEEADIEPLKEEINELTKKDGEDR